jgi:hypothetical protein
MRKTITIRTEPTLRSLLDERATATGKSVSQLIREILELALAPRSTEERAGHLKGRLSLPRRPDEPWRARLRERNWRP